MLVLGLMCDGQYRQMQNYLRDQEHMIHNINMVEEVTDFLQYFYHDLNIEIIDLVHLMLQTLIEMCVGNTHNLVIISNKQIITIINRILLINISDYDEEIPSESAVRAEDTTCSSPAPSQITMKTKSIDLKGSAVELLEAMLEETSYQTKDLMQLIAGVLDVSALHDTLGDFYKLKDDPDVKRERFDDDAQRGLFRTYHILVHLADNPEIHIDDLG